MPRPTLAPSTIPRPRILVAVGITLAAALRRISSPEPRVSEKRGAC